MAWIAPAQTSTAGRRHVTCWATSDGLNEQEARSSPARKAASRLVIARYSRMSRGLADQLEPLALAGVELDEAEGRVFCETRVGRRGKTQGDAGPIRGAGAI